MTHLSGLSQDSVEGPRREYAVNNPQGGPNFVAPKGNSAARDGLYEGGFNALPSRR